MKSTPINGATSTGSPKAKGDSRPNEHSHSSRWH